MEGGRARRGWRDPGTERTGEDRSGPGASFPVTASSGSSERRRSLVRGRERFGEKGGGRNRRKKGRRGAAWWWPPTAGLLLELRELLLLAGVGCWSRSGSGQGRSTAKSRQRRGPTAEAPTACSWPGRSCSCSRWAENKVFREVKRGEHEKDKKGRVGWGLPG